jgi:hypothetical protein
VPFGFLCQTITITWYALHGDPQADLHARRRSAPWYRQKTTVSYTDILAALRRDLIRHDFWAQAPLTTKEHETRLLPGPADARDRLNPESRVTWTRSQCRTTLPGHARTHRHGSHPDA